MDEAPKRLACQSCQRRKIKCDRDMPCGTCSKNGSKCVPVHSQRLARGRNGGRGKRDTVVAARLARLESVLASLQTSHDPETSTNKPLNHDYDGQLRSPGSMSSQYQYLGGAFWKSLQDELTQVQDAYEDELQHCEAKNDLAEDACTPDTAYNDTSSLPLVDVGIGSFVSAVLVQSPPPGLRKELCAVFFTNVDPVFKVLHAPSVRAHIEQDAPYLDYEDDSTAVTALKFAIYYAAIATMSEQHCIASLGQSVHPSENQWMLSSLL